jgi:hypothetical protein
MPRSRPDFGQRHGGGPPGADAAKTAHESQLAGWSAFIRTLLVRNESLFVD